jgi:hypothetical protein
MDSSPELLSSKVLFHKGYGVLGLSKLSLSGRNDD